MHRMIAKHREDGSFTDKKRTGRPRNTTAREDNLIKRMVMRSPTSSIKKIRIELLRRDRQITGNGHMTNLTISAKQFGSNFLH